MIFFSFFLYEYSNIAMFSYCSYSDLPLIKDATRIWVTVVLRHRLQLKMPVLRHALNQISQNTPLLFHRMWCISQRNFSFNNWRKYFYFDKKKKHFRLGHLLNKCCIWKWLKLKGAFEGYHSTIMTDTILGLVLVASLLLLKKAPS